MAGIKPASTFYPENNKKESRLRVDEGFAVRLVKPPKFAKENSTIVLPSKGEIMKKLLRLRSAASLGLCSVLVSLFLVVGVFGQETTGSIEGIVSDSSGARVPGATVKIEGVGFVRSVTTNSDGFFRALQIPPGVYKVSVASANFSPAVAEGVNVLLGKASPVDFSLKVGQVQEQVVITSDDVTRIDPTDNKIQTNITSKTVESLPKGVNFTSLLKLSPATRAEPKSGQFQVDGASGSENLFTIDGQEVNNFRTGVLNQNNNIPFNFVQEVQIKTSGFEAQYGGATGGVINVVTKGGGNEFHGMLEYQFEPGSLWAGPRQVLDTYRVGTGAAFRQTNTYVRGKRDEFVYHYPAFTLSGPIVKDRLWFLTSYAPQIQNRTRNAEYYNTNPALRQTPYTREVYKTREKYEYFFARLDAAPVNSLRLTGTFTWNPIIQDGVIPGSSSGNFYIGGAPPSANFGGSVGNLVGNQLTNAQGGRQNANNTTFQAVWTPTSKLITSFRFSRGFLNEKLNSYFIPQQTRFICTGLTVPPSAGCTLGYQNFTSNSGILYDASERLNYEADASYLVNELAGRHEFKGGYQNSKVSNDVSRGYVPYGIVQLYYGYTINDLTGRDDPVDKSAIGAGRLIRFGTVGAASNRAQSIYIQDKWQPISRLSISGGVRFEKEDLPSFNGYAPPINFGFGDKIAPRLGVAFDPTGSGKTKIFASYGQFYDRLKFELPRGSFGGDFYRIDYFDITTKNPQFDYYTLQRVLGNNQDVLGGKCPITNSTGLTRCQYDYRIASNDPQANLYTGQVDPNLKPFRQTEFTVGVEREFSRNWLLSARYTHKNLDEAIEDAGFPTPEGSEAYIIGNPGKGLHAEVSKQFGYAKTTTPERVFDGMEIRLDRRFSGSYFFNVAYTYSRLYGNYSGLASSDENGRTSPGVNRFFDLPHLGFTAAGTPDNGRLATDRPHVFNAYGGYEFKWLDKIKNNSTLISFFTTAQSGTPQTSFYTLYAAAVLYGRGNLGRSPTFTQTDFALSHRVRIKEDYQLTFDFNVINLFNEANVLTVLTEPAAISPSISTLKLPVSNEPEALNYVLTKGIVNEFNAYLNDPANPQRKNTALGYATGFQGGRQIRFGVRFNF
jgi:hypothetical protein